MKSNPLKSFAKELGCNVNEIIDFYSNINFLKPKVNFDFNALDISLYPTYEKLYKKIAHNYQIKVSELELYNGGSAAIYALLKYLNLDDCVIYTPTSLQYKKACQHFGYKLHTINRFENIFLPVKKGALIIFANPSIPDGTYYDMYELMKYWISQECTIIIDESFLEFCEGTSVFEYLSLYERLYILKSMSKFYSSAGIRIAALISTQMNIKKLKEIEPSWKLSQFDSHYLQIALEDNSFKKISKAVITKNRIELEKILQNSSCVEFIYESSSNYVLVKLKSITVKTLQEKLKKHKILIRDCTLFDGMDESFACFSVKSSQEIMILKEAMDFKC